MRVIVSIKQVPETKSVKMDETTGTVIREGVESIVNPLDLYAIEAALQLKEKYQAHVTVISMGPPKAQVALREALAMGADDAVLVSDKAFAGSDTWATSYILSAAVRKIGDIDLVICGERATDGDTGQVGPGIAAWLDMPVLTYVSRISSVENGNFCKAERLIEDGYEHLQVALPAVLTVVKEVSEPRLPTLRGKQRAKKTEIPVWSLTDLDVNTDKIGLKGSPTKVVKIAKPKVARECEKLKAADEQSIEKAVDRLCGVLQEVTK